VFEGLQEQRRVARAARRKGLPNAEQKGVPSRKNRLKTPSAGRSSVRPKRNLHSAQKPRLRQRGRRRPKPKRRPARCSGRMRLEGRVGYLRIMLRASLPGPIRSWLLGCQLTSLTVTTAFSLSLSRASLANTSSSQA
jgi:hypothetical protein